MGAKVGQERKSPTEESFNQISDIAPQLLNGDESMRTWLQSSYLSSSHIRRLAFDLDLIKSRFPVGANILEIGTIPPMLTGALAKLNYCISGVDIAPERMSDAIKTLGLEVKKCDIEKDPLPFPDESFDLVLFNEVFEHLRLNPIFTVQEIGRVLKVEGKLMLTTPNLRSVEGIFNFLFLGKAYWCCGDLYNEYSKLTRIGHMGHVREYTPQEVTAFLKHLNFEIEEIVFRGGYNSRKRSIVSTLTPGRLRPHFMVIARRRE